MTAAAERFRERMKDLWGTIGCQTIQHVQGTGLWFPFTLEREYLMWSSLRPGQIRVR